MNFKSALGPVVAWVRCTRCQCLLVMVLLCLGLRENYPFSNFPMYSSFRSTAYYIYLTDADGRSLKTRDLGLGNSSLKKIFDGHYRRRLEHFKQAGSKRQALAEAAAAQALLDYLDGLTSGRPKSKKLLAGLQVQYVRVRQDGHDLIFETRLLATHP